MCVQVRFRNSRSCDTIRQPAAKLAQKLFQQHLRAQVEKVRRLVEHQQVRIVQQQGGQLGARLPAAGKLADRPVEHRVGKLKLPGDLAASPIGLAAVAHQELANGLAGLERIVLPQVAQPQLAGRGPLRRRRVPLRPTGCGKASICRPRCGRSGRFSGRRPARSWPRRAGPGRRSVCGHR